MVPASITTSAVVSRLGREKGLALLRQAGFCYVDYGLTSSAYQPFRGIYTLDDSAFAQLFLEEKAAYHQAGLKIHQVHAPYNPPPDQVGEEELAFFVSAVKRSILAATFLESPYIVIHPVIFPDWEENPQRSVQLNLRLFQEYVAIGSENGVRVALENMPGGGEVPYNNGEKMVDLLQSIPSDFFVACLDTGHAACSFDDPLMPAKMARQLGKKLQVLHIHDNQGHRDTHQFPFTGIVDWTAFSQALGDVGYCGTYSLEPVFPKDMGESLFSHAVEYLYHVAVALGEMSQPAF